MSHAGTLDAEHPHGPLQPPGDTTGLFGVFRRRYLLGDFVLVGHGLIVGGHVELGLLDLGITGDLGELPILVSHLAKKTLRSAIRLPPTRSRAFWRRARRASRLIHSE